MAHRDSKSMFYNDYSYHFFDLNILYCYNLQVGLVTSSVTYFYKLSGETPNNADTRIRNRSFALLFFLSRPFKLRRGRCVIKLYMVNSQLIFSRSSDNWFTHIRLIFTRGHRISTLL